MPLNPTAYGDSPYQSPSSFAGNPYFVDLDELKSAGLLSDIDLESQKDCCERVNYGRLFETRINVLEKAYSNFKKNAAFTRFCNSNSWWLDDYALFFSLKEEFNYAP